MVGESFMLLRSRVCCLSVLSCHVSCGKSVTAGIDSPLVHSVRVTGLGLWHEWLSEQRRCTWLSISGFEGAAQLYICRSWERVSLEAECIHRIGRLICFAVGAEYGWFLNGLAKRGGKLKLSLQHPFL